MNKSTYIIDTLQKLGLDINKMISSSINTGGAITFTINDVVCFSFDCRFTQETAYIEHLANNRDLKQEVFESFCKHFLFDKNIARAFVKWQRSCPQRAA